MRPWNRVRACCLLTVILLLSGCGGPQAQRVSREQALAERRVLDLTILHVHDALKVNDHCELGITHLIEVKVVGGPPDLIGREFTLPYDEWQVGAAAPAEGERIHIAPYTWVAGDGTSKGRPIGGWEVPR